MEEEIKLAFKKRFGIELKNTGKSGYNSIQLSSVFIDLCQLMYINDFIKNNFPHDVKKMQTGDYVNFYSNGNTFNLIVCSPWEKRVNVIIETFLEILNGIEVTYTAYSEIIVFQGKYENIDSLVIINSLLNKFSDIVVKNESGDFVTIFSGNAFQIKVKIRE